jgi:DNA-binding transcriptional MocR family regulator
MSHPTTELGPDTAPLYLQVATRIESMIEGGTFAPGERVPSVRKLSRQLAVSITTVLEAYRVLEDRMLLEARPQSGYYVRTPAPRAPEPRATSSTQTAEAPEISDLALRFLLSSQRRDVLPLGSAIPHPDFLPVARLNRLLIQAVRKNPSASQSYDHVAGLESLRVQIGRRALDAGCALSPEDIVTTSGAQAAVHLCLRAVTKPGDTVVVETPTYYGLLEALESLHLVAIEVATDPRTGIVLGELEKVLERQPIAACVLSPTFGNPLGHCMPDAAKRELVAMLARRRVPLIEDDVYGELAFTTPRPRAAKSFDREGLVLLCSSFSKSVAPGYRIGWTAPGRFRLKVEKLKFSSSVATATPTQMAIAAFLAEGGFDRTLRRLRREYRDLTARMALAVSESFPTGTRVTRPGGGHVIWVEMPPEIDSVRLHEEALVHGVSVAPGILFSASGRYRNCIRLNCALPWTPRVERAIEDLGRLAAAQRG